MYVCLACHLTFVFGSLVGKTWAKIVRSINFHVILLQFFKTKGKASNSSRRKYAIGHVVDYRTEESPEGSNSEMATGVTLTVVCNSEVESLKLIKRHACSCVGSYLVPDLIMYGSSADGISCARFACRLINKSKRLV